MGADQSKQLENTLFNLKFSAKSLVRESKKCEKAEKEEKAKVKKAIQKGNTEGARIYAENAIRNKSQVMRYLLNLRFYFNQIKRQSTFCACRHASTPSPVACKLPFQCSA